MEEKTNANREDREEIYAKAVRAGKRTYFFDVRTTRGGDYFLTITESKRRYNDDGTFRYQKHKIFLYKEDFDKFTEALTETVAKINEFLQSAPAAVATPSDSGESSGESSKFTDVSFEDLGTDESSATHDAVKEEEPSDKIGEGSGETPSEAEVIDAAHDEAIAAEETAEESAPEQEPPEDTVTESAREDEEQKTGE